METHFSSNVLTYRVINTIVTDEDTTECKSSFLTSKTAVILIKSPPASFFWSFQLYLKALSGWRLLSCHGEGRGYNLCSNI